MAQAKKGGTRNQLTMPGMGTDEFSPPEWRAAEDAVAESLANNPAAWEKFIGCRMIEVYTDGSAPVRNPGGPLGCAAVFAGYVVSIDQSVPNRPPAQARLELGAYVPERMSEPRTSNNRAEIAAMMMGLEALYRLEVLGCKPEKVTIWSDSEYTIRCMNGSWQRKKNTDLWPQMDILAERLRSIIGGDFEVKWVKGHAGTEYNEIADELATQAAFNFSTDLYERYRKAQQESGKELPSPSDLSKYGITTSMSTNTAPSPAAQSASTSDMQLIADKADEAIGWQAGTDYTLAIHTKIVGESKAGQLTGTYQGQYQLWSRDGRSYRGQIRHDGLHTFDEANYLTLIWAVNEVAQKASANGSSIIGETLTIYSGRELMAKQLAGLFKVKAENLKRYYDEARRLLGRFKSVEVVWKQGDGIKELFR